MADYTIAITDGSGSATIPVGNYTVVATNVTSGYDVATLDPTVLTATVAGDTTDFTIEATAGGTLTLDITETGVVGGTPITGGTFIRCSADGSTTYGDAKTVSALGQCIFDNVPFGGALPCPICVKQLTSDATHDIYTDVISVSMATATYTEEVANARKQSLQRVTLTDANYSGLPIEAGDLELTIS